MTNRDFFNAIANGTMNEEVIEHAKDALQKMDHANETRRAKTAEKAVEKEAAKAPVREALVNVMTAEPKTATMLIAEAGVELKPQAIPSLLKGLVAAGTIEKVDVKIKGKGTQKGYRLPVVE